MAAVITRITVAEAATVINAAITVIQYTLALALVIVLGYTIRRRLSTNTPMAWSVITRMLQSSLWPTLLRTDSAASSNAGFCVSLFSKLFLLSGILIALAGVITPLGLEDGPLVQFRHSFMHSLYIPDISPIGLATSPREDYEYSRICGAWSPMPCPGNGDNSNTSQIAPSIINIFSSTSHSPFRIQFRQYYKGVGGYNYSMLLSSLTTTQSLILREDIFAVEGLVVDLTEHPGVGFWNHTFPTAPRGGTWSNEVLWLEPISSCVNTNLTIDYKLMGGPNLVKEVNLTDRGGFVNLSHDYPTLNRSGQHINISEHAYKGAVLSNFFAMLSFNLTAGNESHIGRTFPLDIYSISAGYFQHLGMAYSPNITAFNVSDMDISCEGYGGGDAANITNVGVHCGMLLGPPRRTDGGDPRVPGDNSTWTQSLHACAGVTRASIQKVDFSFNGTLDLSALRISRQATNTSVLWAVENTVLNISDVDLFWGRVADSYENDPSLTTIRSQFFYLPAGGSDTWGVVSAGQPTTIPAAVWSNIYSSAPLYETEDYTGRHSFALTNKFRSLVEADPFLGPAQINNLIWTDLVANNLVGSDTNATLLVAENEPSVSYDLRYGIPAALLLALWLPVFLAATFMLLTGTLKFSYMRYLLNHTSVGRIVVGSSALHVVNGPSPKPNAATSLESGSFLTEEMPATPSTPAELLCTADFAKTTGTTLVALKSAVPPGNKGDSHPLLTNEGGDEDK